MSSQALKSLLVLILGALVALPAAAQDYPSRPVMSMSPAEFDRFLRAEIEKWGKVVKASDMKVE